MPRINVSYNNKRSLPRRNRTLFKRHNQRRGWKIIFFLRVILELGLVILAIWGLNLGIRMLADPITFPIKHVRIIGELKYLENKNIDEVVAPATTGGFLLVDIRKVRKAALTIPWVDDAHVRRLWPDTLRINIIEQVPVARWLPGGLVNSRGEVFNPDPLTYPENLPNLGGAPDSAADMLNHLKRLNQVLSSLKINDTKPLSVTTLQVDERRAWTMVLSNGIQLLLGKKDLDNRLARFLRIYPSALAAQAERIASLSLIHI